MIDLHERVGAAGCGLPTLPHRAALRSSQPTDSYVWQMKSNGGSCKIVIALTISFWN
jgi:hypothetical protein